MRRSGTHLVTLGLLAGLLPVALEVAGAPPAKPAPTPTPKGCPTCEIVYTQAAKGFTARKDLMLMTKDGASKTVLLAGSGGVGHGRPSWAPDGQWIAFYTTTNAGGSVRVIRNDGTGLTTVATTCTALSRGQAWRPVSIDNGYWMVYLDARRSDGSCIVETSPYRSNLWAVDLSLGSPVLTGGRVCLTCELNPDDADLWSEPS